jgi:hypothetical protein
MTVEWLPPPTTGTGNPRYFLFVWCQVSSPSLPLGRLNHCAILTLASQLRRCYTKLISGRWSTRAARFDDVSVGRRYRP